MSPQDIVKWLFFPGFNLHAQLRYRLLPRYLEALGPSEGRRMLDAGCGNGMLSYQAYRRGNRVIGLTLKEDEAKGCHRLFNELLGIPEDRLSFRVKNLYEVRDLDMQFDEIVCSEVLEHIVRDAEVCRSFYEVLKSGGILHLCCPNAEHPDNANKVLDVSERGGHVRPGYTMQSYRALLEPLGFRIINSIGLGGLIRQWFNSRIIRAQETNRPLLASVLFVAALPLLWMDWLLPSTPYSLYVKAQKPA